MKRYLRALTLVSLFGISSVAGTAVADTTQQADTTVMADTTAKVADSLATDSMAAVTPAKPEPKKTEEKKAEAPKETLHQVIKKKFVEGGPLFMGIVLACLILGLAVAIERVIALNLASVNVKRLLDQVRGALANEGVDAAKDVCARTQGPVAAIYAQGLQRYNQGLAEVEKAIISYGSVEAGKLERGMTWIALFISLAPMFGFMGTVIGMIDAFDKIEAAEDMKIADVAGGIKVALLTTVGGLIVAVILQIFYNYCSSKIDKLVNEMEEAAVALVDVLIEDKNKLS